MTIRKIPGKNTFSKFGPGHLQAGVEEDMEGDGGAAAAEEAEGQSAEGARPAGGRRQAGCGGHGHDPASTPAAQARQRSG